MHKLLNLIKKTHQQTFKYQITFKMMKNMFGIHKVIRNNEHLICFHGGKNAKGKNQPFGF